MAASASKEFMSKPGSFPSFLFRHGAVLPTVHGLDELELRAEHLPKRKHLQDSWIQ